MGRRSIGSLRFRPDRGAYYIQFTYQGRRIQRRACDARSEADQGARQKAEHMRQEVLRRVALGQGLEVILHDVFGELTGHKLTFRQAAPAFLQYRESRTKPSTFRNDVFRLRGLCKAAWAGKQLAAVSPNDLVSWVNRRKAGAGKASGATTNRDLALCSALFRWAQAMGYVSSNPARLVDRDSERGRARTMWLSVSECQALLDAAAPHFRVVLLCLLHAGLRRGELLSLEWRSVDLDRKELVVEPENAKTGRVRHVPLTSRLARELEALKGAAGKSTGWVFRNATGGQCTHGWLRHWLCKTLAACAELSEERKRKTSLHVLRHTFASHMAQEGVPLHDIGYLLGHSTQSVTERYAHLAPGAGRGAISVLGRRLDGDPPSTVSEFGERYVASECPESGPEVCPAGSPQRLSA